ncbi:MAG: DUF58 domain-containing protein, partial [Clostridia bacterium]|nr:DUF58 domain-containing protein [Clostridia bacterium]
KKAESRIYLTVRFWLYIALIVFAVVFTQALISSVSAVILVFLILIPIISVLYLIIQAYSIKVYLNSDTTEIEKNMPADFSLTVANESPLPYPFLEAMISVTSEDAVRCENQLTRLSLIPFGRYIIKKTPVFRYRGSYMIGVTNMYIYDLFRMIRFRMDTNLYHEIFVLPRKLYLNVYSASENADEQTETISRSAGNDNTEVNDIRDYIPGDGMRSIHWKLSSKADSLLVKEFAKNNEKQSVIFVDTVSRYQKDSEKWEDDINEFVVDGLIETALALVSHDVTVRNSAVKVIWPDPRIEGGICSMDIETNADYDEFYRMFATAPLQESDVQLGEFANIMKYGLGNAVVRFLSGRIDDSLAASLSELSSSDTDHLELYTFIPFEKINAGFKKAYVDSVEIAQLSISKSGITIYDARDGRITVPDAHYSNNREVNNG